VSTLTSSGGQTDYCVVITTCSTSEQAEVLCSALLERQLAACVQVLDITSSYLWKGQRESEPEKLLLIKTRRDLYGAIEAALGDVHPYETPEIICVPVVAGSAGYLGWIDEVTRPETTRST
jgi:periplasmic divalent cation tolerance protein